MKRRALIAMALTPVFALMAGAAVVVLISIVGNGGAWLISLCLGYDETVWPNAESMGEVMAIFGSAAFVIVLVAGVYHAVSAMMSGDRIK
jgi:hypothetical protein